MSYVAFSPYKYLIIFSILIFSRSYISDSYLKTISEYRQHLNNKISIDSIPLLIPKPTPKTCGGPETSTTSTKFTKHGAKASSRE